MCKHQLAAFRAARPDDDVTFRLYESGHTVVPDEVDGVMAFWLGEPNPLPGPAHP